MDYDPELKSTLWNRERLMAVKRSKMLDSPNEKMFDDVTDAVCHTLDVPMSLVTIIDADRQFFKSCVGLARELMEQRETPIEDSACQYVVKKRSMILINDVKNDPFFHCHMGLNNINAGAYLGVPLIRDRQVIGSVCAIDTRARDWQEADIDFLEKKADMLREEIARR